MSRTPRPRREHATMRRNARVRQECVCVEAQDRAKVGSVSPQGCFHSILSQIPKLSNVEIAEKSANAKSDNAFPVEEGSLDSALPNPVRNGHDTTRSIIAKLRNR